MKVKKALSIALRILPFLLIAAILCCLLLYPRGVTVYSQELPEYCDLYQYISVLSREKREDCDAFVDTLLSNDVQTTLSRIGMYPVNGGNAKRTVSVFSDRESLRKLAESASGGIAGNFLDKYLKFI